jgi:hypothetical protein
MGKITTGYSIVGLGKMLSIENNESSSTEPVRKVEDVIQDVQVVF